MYSTYAFRIFVCKALWLSRPPGARIHEKEHLRIQEGHFLKRALNLDLTRSNARSRHVGDFWVELRLREKKFGPQAVYSVS